MIRPYKNSWGKTFEDAIADNLAGNLDCAFCAATTCLGVARCRGLNSPQSVPQSPYTTIDQRRPTYNVVLHAGSGSARRKLGFDLDMGQDCDVLIILAITGGLAQKWNQ